MSAGIRAGASNDGAIQINGVDAIKFDAQGIERVAFSAHNNGVAQSIPNNSYTVVSLSTEVYDHGGLFASNAWTPPAGRPVLLTGVVNIVSASATGGLLLTIFKNGVEFKRGSHAQLNISSGAQSCFVSCTDIPNGTDVYTLRVFQSSSVSLNTDGSSAATHFEGVRL